MKKGTGKESKHKRSGRWVETSGSEGASSTGSLPRSEPHVAVGGSHDRGSPRVDGEGREATRRNLHPDVEVVEQSGPSQGGSDDGRKTDGVDHPPPSAPSISHRGGPDGTWRSIFQLLPLTVSPDNVGDSDVPDRTQEALTDQSEPETADEKKSSWKSTASTTAKFILRGVRDSADAFGPLKSVAGGLCFILENCEVWCLSHINDP